MMLYLRNWAFAAVFYAGSVPIVLGAPIAALLGAPVLRWYVHAWVGFHRICARIFLGIRIRVEGRPPPGPALFAAKHQSLFETFELTHMLGGASIVMKQELASIPVWGWAAKRYGHIVIDRAGAAKALRGMLAAGEKARAEGRSVVIFPEGTRVLPGQQPPLQPGFAGLYRALGLPIVPVALDSGVTYRRRGLKRPGVITFRFGEPLPPGVPRKELEEVIHAEINTLER